MNIRPATRKDAQEIAAIWNYYIRTSIATFNPNEKSTDELREMVENKQINGDAFYVAAGEVGILGFGTYGAFRGGAGYARTKEHTIHLAASARGRGVGRGLLEAVENHGRKVGVHSMIAGVSHENEAGIAFHLACDYVEIARLPQVGYKFGRWHDLILLQKYLKE